MWSGRGFTSTLPLETSGGPLGTTQSITRATTRHEKAGGQGRSRNWPPGGRVHLFDPNVRRGVEESIKNPWQTLCRRPLACQPSEESTRTHRGIRHKVIGLPLTSLPSCPAPILLRTGQSSTGWKGGRRRESDSEGRRKEPQASFSCGDRPTLATGRKVT